MLDAARGQRRGAVAAGCRAGTCGRTWSKTGDSVRTIASQFGVTNETIIWENDLTDPDILPVGQELHILPFSGLIHEVRPGRHAWPASPTATTR